ncbi:hypothetical protein FHS39_002406 [Streptomyces olivoverticillatus]|uniref:Uncharacterized protein n=1 Tax=Streptomyces olivoverticillatus TaxID=66427 RepID=A0A7W7PM20_9ACTN|nr:hypothetical protein [Streptomyces olivoverticillatus]MBB4893375.1 hypothetical protein [Streptomyces olivoverticillatus]
MARLFDQTLSGSGSRTRTKLNEHLAERAKASEDRLALLMGFERELAQLDDTGRCSPARRHTRRRRRVTVPDSTSAERSLGQGAGA